MSIAAKCVIISGLSGAGKSTALRILEYRGFYVVDNLPPVMLPLLIETLSADNAAETWGVAAVVGARVDKVLNELEKSVESIEGAGVKTELVFLEAADEVLVRRFEETRRRHPMGEGGTIIEGITRERAELSALKNKASTVIDTSGFNVSDFRSSLMAQLGMNGHPFTVIVSSFGFKNGVPRDCDYMFDTRFLPNPNYVPELKPLSGRNTEVRKYLDRIPEKQVFMKHLVSFMEFILKHY